MIPRGSADTGTVTCTDMLGWIAVRSDLANYALDWNARLLDAMSAELAEIGDDLRQPEPVALKLAVLAPFEKAVMSIADVSRDHMELGCKDLELEITHDYDMNM
jgi:hypothetical protein